MRFGIHTPNFGEFHDARVMADLAREAEDAGWDGYFIWDHVFWTWPNNQPAADPWTLLTAMAAAAERIRIGPLVTPLPRRRPQTLARQTATLDRFSGGRLILGVGIGGDWFGDYSAFGETPDQKVHGEMLDEGLEVLAQAWSGEEFSFEGRHFAVREAQFLPKPIQEPRIPVWVAGMWPGTKPFRRAARWDGVFPLRKDDEPMQPQDHRAMISFIMEHRDSSAPFDVVHGGNTPGDDYASASEIVAPYADAGVTWWLESFGSDATVEETRKRIRQGPPSLRK
jgi:alkanesulfonate monooxygenase SsuD/methylene tetrahydromethanopterin reductase-like flavin-dependent oxidoreductase (luciferase family)